MKFVKMHGLGNDYVCIQCFNEKIKNPEKLSVKLCDRHLGVGADGMILIHPSSKADFRMEIYNADGSIAQMCGNGIRCMAKYVYEQGLTTRHSLQIETLSGIKELELEVQDGTISSIRVNMGVPKLDSHSIPILNERDIVIQEPIWVGQQLYYITGVSMGNPHAVVFVNDTDTVPLNQIGIPFEFHSRFPNRMNIEFCQILSSDKIRVRVWERGVGETMACGTGACAAVVASVLSGFTTRDVEVCLNGGNLQIHWDSKTDTIYMTGPATLVFQGEIINFI